MLSDGKLSLSGWQLRELNSTLTHLRGVKNIDVANNRITTLPDLGGLTGLESLLLSQNEHLGRE